MRSFVRAVPLSPVALVIALIVALIGSPHVARRLGTPTAVAALLLSGSGLVVAATLTPHARAFKGEASDGRCDASRLGLAPISEYMSVSHASLNVLLLVPLGLAVGMLPRTPTSTVVALGASSLPFVVEATQLKVTALGRGCQTADIVDNLLGLGIGVAIGALARRLLPFARRRSSTVKHFG